MEEILDSDIQSDNSQSGEFTNLPTTPPGQDGGTRMENAEEILSSDISPETSQGVEAAENLKMKEQSGNFYENKGPTLSSPGRSGNVIENKGSYAQNAGMLLKTKEVDGMS